MNYKVGQILYVVLNKQTAVYPMQVIEEITKKTLGGVEVDYILRGGGSDSKGQSIKLCDVDGEVFETSERAKKVLIDRVVDTITKRVDAAVVKAKEWYPESFENFLSQRKKVEVPKIAPEVIDDVATIDLGNGLVGRINMPESFET